MKTEDKFLFNDFSLRLDTEWVGRNLLYFEQLESSNTYLKAEAEKENLPTGTVVLTEYQTNGRGRLDRVWLSNPAENLTFSLLLRPNAITPKNLNLLSLGAAVVVAETVENFLLMKCDLKWPNDVLLNKKKVCGILAESTFTGNKFQYLVLGIGLNVNQNEFAGKHAIPPTSLKLEAGQLLERERLMSALLNGLERMIHQLDEDPKLIVKKWKNNCSKLGEILTIVNGPASFTGRFEDVDDDGSLVLLEDGKIRKYAFGEVRIS